MRETTGRGQQHLLWATKAFFIFMVILFLQGCDNNEGLKKKDLTTEYQSIQMDNNTSYFGKIQKIGTNYIELTDIYLMAPKQSVETKQGENKIIKRSKEMYGQDRVYINMRHVVVIEPVSPDSRLFRALKYTGPTDIE